MKSYLLGLILIGQVIFTSCGEDSTESVILGNWLGTNIVRENCDDPLNNGGLNCVNNLDQCFSCIELALERDGTYSLTSNFDGSPANETGDYEAKNSVIRLNPTNGAAYDLPISEVSETNMVIDLTLTNGCTGIITLKNVDC